MNQLQRGFLDAMFNVSYSLKDYYDNKGYLELVSVPDKLTDNIVFNKTIDIIINELEEMGILLDVSDDRYTSVTVIQTIQYLRVIFDKRTLTERLITNINLTESLQNIIDTLEDPKGYIHSMVDSITANSPAGLEFSHIKDLNSLYTSNDLFVSYIGKLIEDIFDRPEQLDDEKLIVFTKALNEHYAIVKKNVDYLTNHSEIQKLDEIIDPKAIMNVLTKTYRKISNRFPPALFDLYLCELDPHPFFKDGFTLNAIVNIRKDIKPFIDYYGKMNTQEFIYTELIMIACEYYRPSWTIEKNHQFIKREMETNNLINEIYPIITRFQDLISQRGNM